MTTFLIGALLLVMGTLLLLIRPLLRRSGEAGAPSQRQLNVATYREQLERLDEDVAHGVLAPADEAAVRAELQRRAVDETRHDGSIAVSRSPRATAWGIALLVPLAAVGLYLVIGSPGSLQGGAATHQAGDDEVARMVEKLAQRLEREPGDVQGWAMLARSYKVMGRNVDAEKAFDRAGAAIASDATLLASHADVAAANAGGHFAGKPAALIARALQIDPNHPTALWLAGTAALERKDNREALLIWERLAGLLPAGSDDSKMLQGAIDDVRSRAGVALEKSAQVTPSSPTAVRAGAAASGAGTISGTIEVDAALRGRTAPGDILMVIARVPGSRMPVAVLRVPASSGPMQFTLDDSLAMSPQGLLSSATVVEVEARISKSGQAKAQAGDLASPVRTVQVGARGVRLDVSKVQP